ncbi:MAG: LacI family DNA-binding transcriptional regulator [Frankia sp.]|nr:LacI family DNA-binding transcriptional regulator [Frankia sp.]
MSERTRRVTSSDVAAASGVSQATVSYVINNTPGQTISAATRARVLRAAAELGYVPSSAGRALRRGRTHNVILDTSETPQGFEAAFVNAFCDILHQHGYTVAVIHATDTAPKSLENLAQSLSPVGVVRLAPPTPEQVAFLRQIGVQQISHTDFDPQQPRAKQIWDLSSAAQVNHLFETGHRSIGYCLPSEPHMQKVGYARAAGAGRRARELGIRHFRVFDSAGSLEELCKVLEDVVQNLRNPVDAIACFSDQVAFQVLGALHRLGIKVPDQVAVIGVNDSPIAPYSVPPLTTVRVPADKFGADMALRLLDALGHEVTHVDPEDFSFSIVRRESA